MEMQGTSGLFQTKADREIYRKTLMLKSTLLTYSRKYIIELVNSLFYKDNIKDIEKLVYRPMSEFNDMLKTRVFPLDMLELAKNGMFSFSDDYFQVDKYNGKIHSIKETDYIEMIEEYTEWIAKIILENDCTLDDNLQKRKEKILKA